MVDVKDGIDTPAIAPSDVEGAVKYAVAEGAQKLRESENRTDRAVEQGAQNLRESEAEGDREKQFIDVWTPRFIAVTVILGFFATLFWMIWKNKDTAMLIGALIVAFTTVLSAHFGHTTSSGRKTEALIKQMESKNVPK